MNAMYIIKQQPEDFRVKEIFELEIKPEGEFSYFRLKKKNQNTLNALQKIADALKLPLKYFGFAGSKDKKAITEQICSAKNVSKEKLERLHIKDAEIIYLGKGNKPISLGEHSGNQFKITIRNINKIPEFKTKFLNLFGEQRLSVDNAKIGKLLVQKKFSDAVSLLSVEPDVQEYINALPSDAVGALRKIPVRLLKFYVHAYQSYLWNKLAEKHQDEQSLPIIGFSTDESVIVKNILKEENIVTRDFIIRQLPEISAEGSEHAVWAEAKNLKIGCLEDDELNAGMKKVVLEFELDKGCYATEFLRQSLSD